MDEKNKYSNVLRQIESLIEIGRTDILEKITSLIERETTEEYRSINCSNMAELWREVKQRRDLGHKLCHEDQPLKLNIGVKDHTRKEWLLLKIALLKRTRPDLEKDGVSSEESEMIRQCMTTLEGKDKLFRHNM